MVNHRFWVKDEAYLLVLDQLHPLASVTQVPISILATFEVFLWSLPKSLDLGKSSRLRGSCKVGIFELDVKIEIGEKAMEKKVVHLPRLEKMLEDSIISRGLHGSLKHSRRK